MATSYRPAPEVEATAARLQTGEHARFFEHLEDAPIIYLYRDPPATSGGKTTWAKARAITGLNAYLATKGQSPTLFVVEVASAIWDHLEPHQQEALIDHELSHITWDPEEGTAKIRGHDIEEFYGTVARHGQWTRGLELFQTAGQMRLDFDDTTDSDGEPWEREDELEPAPA